MECSAISVFGWIISVIPKLVVKIAKHSTQYIVILVGFFIVGQLREGRMKIAELLCKLQWIFHWTGRVFNNKLTRLFLRRFNVSQSITLQQLAITAVALDCSALIYSVSPRANLSLVVRWSSWELITNCNIHLPKCQMHTLFHSKLQQWNLHICQLGIWCDKRKSIKLITQRRGYRSDQILLDISPIHQKFINKSSRFTS